MPVDSQVGEQARFLAGLPVPGTSPLASLQATASYLEHHKAFQRNWVKFEQDHFAPKRQWAAEEFARLSPPSRVLYYLFGGPDFINAAALFPGATTYILVGLEPVGEVRPPEQLSESDLTAALNNLRQSTETTLTFSYFITKDMRESLERTAFRGVVPILYSFLALAGCEVRRTIFGGLNANGLWVESSPSVPGVRIDFLDPAMPGVPKTLFYFRGDLSDSGLRGGSAGLLRWMRSQPPGHSYLKAASYLLHENYFSEARNFLLSHSVSILQDDSGIPLRYFLPEDWALYFFGTYTRPIELFQNRHQPELQRAYVLAGGGRPLPFGTGYNWKSGESNLMLAVRKEHSPIPQARPVPLQNP